MTSEKTIENYLVKQCKLQGWAALKLIDLGHDGHPDRTVFRGCNQIFMVELKTAIGKLTPSQRIRIPKLRRMGYRVHVINSKDQVDHMISDEKRC